MGRNIPLCDDVLDQFFNQMYAGLRRAGVAESELPHVEHCIKARFQHYDRAQLDSRGDLVYGLGLAASTLMFGETAEAASFAILPGLQFGDTVDSVRRLFQGFKITG